MTKIVLVPTLPNVADTTVIRGMALVVRRMKVRNPSLTLVLSHAKAATLIYTHFIVN